MNFRIACLAILLVICPVAFAEPATWNVWPGAAPGENANIGEEHDTTSADGRLVAGRRVMRLTDVTVPQMTFYRAPKGKNTGTTVIVAPGGGFNILAYDLEGTEVAEWLNGIGVNAIVLKYRVPARDPQKRWLAAVQDAQRAVSLARSKAQELDIDPHKIGLMGFSAGAATTSTTALAQGRYYDPVDNVDDFDFRPDFAIPIYGGGTIPDDCVIAKNSPPFFMVIAHDDKDRSIEVAQMYILLKKAGASAELHIYERGGHGYGLRKTEAPVTSWPDRLQDWMKQLGYLNN